MKKTLESFDAINTNDDNHINLGDEYDGEELDVLLRRCDFDNDDSVDRCELFDCLVEVENEYRKVNCHEEFPKLDGCKRP